MTSFTVEFKEGPLLDALTRLAKRGDDLRPVFHEIGAELKRTTRLRFDSQESPAGAKWDPLNEAYHAWKKSKNPPVDKILHFGLDLRDTIAAQVTADTLIVSSNALYARAQQLGYPEGKLPARPFLGISDADRDFIIEALDDYFAAPPNP